MEANRDARGDGGQWGEGEGEMGGGMKGFEHGVRGGFGGGGGVVGGPGSSRFTHVDPLSVNGRYNGQDGGGYGVGGGGGAAVGRSRGRGTTSPTPNVPRTTLLRIGCKVRDQDERRESQLTAVCVHGGWYVSTVHVHIRIWLVVSTYVF